MRQLKAASFFCHWKRNPGWERGSRVVVVLENRWAWDSLLHGFREAFIWFYEVLFLEMGDHIRQNLADVERDLQKLQSWQPDGIVGVGDFCLLQRAYLLREKMGSGGIPLLLLSGRDRWQAFFRNTLWIRGRDGRTVYWGYVGQNERDTLAVLPEGGLLEYLPDAFGREIDRCRSVFHRVYSARTGIDMTPSAGEPERLMWSEGKTERDLCEELAEPLRIRYGIPMEIGSYFAILYLYRLLSDRERQLFDELAGAAQGHADWQLERLACRFCRDGVSAVLLPEQDIPLLTQMAVEGIENHPPLHQPEWKQVEAFYRELCR